MNRMFSEYYEFDVFEDYNYKISDYIPVEFHREQKHKDVINGASNYTQNIEVIDRDKSRRRGSDIIILISDEYYVWSSRCIFFS